MTLHEFVAAEKARFPVRVMCDAFGISRSGYYAAQSRPASKREQSRRELAQQVTTAYAESDGTYGAPRITRRLRQDGVVVTEKTVAKSMKEAGIVARPKKRFIATTDSRATKRIAPNLLERDFNADHPDQVWVTDVTAVQIGSGWGYLAVILDLFSRRVVGWAMSANNDTALAIAALRRAIDARGPSPGLVHHSDQGSPYGSDDYIELLERIDAIRSMSRKGDCWDNAVAESFFSTLEFECIRGRAFVSLAHAHAVVGRFIDGFYNPRRLHSTLDYVSPIEFEIRSALHQEAA